MWKKICKALLPSRLWASFGYAFRGISYVFLQESNMHVHLIAACAVVILGIVFHLSAAEWCAICLCIGAVIAAEMFNSALETLTDLVSPQHHPLAGKAKDIAAGAVMLIAITAVVVGLIIFLPKVKACLF